MRSVNEAHAVSVVVGPLGAAVVDNFIDSVDASVFISVIDVVVPSVTVVVAVVGTVVSRPSCSDLFFPQ